MDVAVALVLIFGLLDLQDGAPLDNNEVKFSIASSRNGTGHWNALVQFQHGDNDGRPLELDLNHTTTTKMEGNNNVLIVASLSGPQQRPGPDYELLPGLGYYKFHAKGKNWYEARKICEQEGAHLAIMNSEAEAKALQKFWIPYTTLFDKWAFIGIHDHYSEGKFVTIFDVPVNETGYNKWYPSEPSGGTLQNCGDFEKYTGLYADVSCSKSMVFFCEQEL